MDRYGLGMIDVGYSDWEARTLLLSYADSRVYFSIVNDAVPLWWLLVYASIN